MLRKMTYFRYFQDYSYGQLITESKKWVNKNNLTRESMLKILDEHEINQYELPDDAKPAHGLFFPRLFLCQEIQKRDKSQEVVFPSSELTKILKSQMDNRQESKQNLLYLLVSCNYNLNEVSIEDVLNILKLYEDPYNISQENLSYIMHIGESAEEIWKYLFSHKRTLTFPQISLIFKSMNTIQYFLEKRYSATRQFAPYQIVADFLNITSDLCDSENAYDIAVLVNEAKFFISAQINDEISMIQWKMFDKLTDENLENDEQLLIIIQNLPKNSYLKEPLKVEKMVRKIEPKLNDIWIGVVLNVFIGISRSGYKVNIQMGTILHEVSVEYLKIFHLDFLINIYNCYRDSGVLTEHISMNILEAIDFSMPKFNSQYEKIIEMIYQSHKQNYSNFILNYPRMFLQIVEFRKELNIDFLFKLHIFLFPHYRSLKLVDTTLDILEEITTNGKYTIPNILLIELQESVLQSFNDQPIFNYQLDSYEAKDEKVLTLASKLNFLIKKSFPAHPLVFKHSTIIKEIMNINDFEVKIDLNNLYYMSKCAWIYKPGIKISDNLLKFVTSQDPSLIHSEKFQEVIFYLLASGASKDLVDFELIDSNSPYFLPICFELGKVPQVTEMLVRNVLNVSLVGEPLLKSILVCIEAGAGKNQIQRLALNLTFKSKVEPDIDIKTLNKFVYMAETKDFEIDLTAYLNFFANHRNFILPNFTQMIKNRLRVSDEEFNKTIEKEVKSIRRTRNSEETQKINHFSSDLRPTLKENLNTLKEVIKHRIPNSVFVGDLINLLKTLDIDESLELISPILEYFSLFSENSKIFDQVLETINEKELMKRLSNKDYINILFFYTISGNNLENKVPDIETRLKQMIEQRDVSYNFLETDGFLKFFHPFSYRTEYEKRFLVSSEMLPNETPNFETGLNSLSLEEYLENLKLYFLIKIYLTRNDEEATQSLNSYFKARANSQSLSTAKKSLKNYISQDNVITLHHSHERFSNNQFKIISDMIFMINSTNSGIIFLDNQEFLENDKSKLLLPVKFFINYLENSSGTKLHQVNIQDWNKKDLPNTSSLLSFIKNSKIHN